MPSGERSAAQAFAFSDFELCLERGELRRRGVPVAIRPKPLELLAHLVTHRDRVVPKEELLEKVWPRVSVSEDALTSALRDLRRALDDAEAPHRFVVTVRARGYRFVGDSLQRGSGRAPSRRDPFLDRDEVMARLRASLHAALDGQFRISLLVGPAGIGKTRTGLELVREARELGIDAHFARCHDGEMLMPLFPWREVIRSCLSNEHASGLGNSAKAVLERVGWIVPEPNGSRTLDARRDLDGLEARFQLFDAVAVLLKELSQRRPMLVFVDDLHAADEASLMLLHFLSGTLADAHVHLVGAFRDEETRSNPASARLLGDVASRPASERMDLVGLARNSVSRILYDAAGSEPSASFLDAVWNATVGNPFFVSELASLVSSGELDVAGGGRVPLPGRVRDAVRIQLQRRSEECQELLKTASLAGREVELAVLSRASELSRMRTLELVEEAEAAGLLAPIPSLPGRYVFVHDLVREAIHRELGSAERTRLHRKMAIALEASNEGDRLAELAFHFCEAAPDGVADKAVTYAGRAAERATALMAYEDAVTHYERALSALALWDDPPRDLRCRLLVAQAEAAWGTLEPPASVQARFERAAEAALDASAPELFARAALGRTGHGSGTADYRDIGAIDAVDIRLLREAADVLGHAPSASRARVLARLALAVRYAEEPSVSESLSAEAVSIAESLGDVETLAAALRYRHEVLSGPEHAEQRIGIAQRILELARRARATSLEIDAWFFLARNRFELGNPGAAREAGDTADALAATLRHPGAYFRTGTRKVLHLTLAGRFDDALDEARRNFERDEPRNLSAEGTYAAQRLAVQWFRGEHDESLALLEHERRRAMVYRCTEYSICHHHVLTGRVAEARAEFEEAARGSFRHVQRDHTFLLSMLILTEICAFFRDAPRARDLYALALPFENMLVAPFIATTCFGATARALGILAHVFGDYARSERHFKHAIAVERELSAPLLAETLLRYGRMLLDRRETGDADRASSVLKRALAIAEEFGMERHRATVAEVLSSAETQRE